jgi:hypothetical protein
MSDIYQLRKRLRIGAERPSVYDPDAGMRRLARRLDVPTQAKTAEATPSTKRARRRNPAPSPAPPSPSVPARKTIERYVAEREAEELRKAAESEVFTSLVKALVEERTIIDDRLEEVGLIERGEWCETCGESFFPSEGHECDGAYPLTRHGRARGPRAV